MAFLMYPGRMRVLVALGLLFWVGCEGSLSSTEAMDAGGGGGGADAPSLPSDDAASPVADDAAMSVMPDAYITPSGDCTMGPPLDTPIAGCRPTPMPSTGDPAEDCVRRINQFRCECQHLPPLMRWRDGEACANQMAQYDSEHPDRAHAGFIDGICSGGRAQNECPGCGSIEQTVSGCLQQMWDEGPGDFYGPPPHGHYINMSSTSHTMVACGFYDGPSGVYAAQNFR
jgi:hypothetical protein